MATKEKDHEETIKQLWKVIKDLTNDVNNLKGENKIQND